VPVFFVSSGIRLDLTGLLHSPSALARVPLFLLALLTVRGLPALLGLRANGTRPTLALGLLQATSLPFIVTATQIGVALVCAACYRCSSSRCSSSGVCAGTSRARPPSPPQPRPYPNRISCERARVMHTVAAIAFVIARAVNILG
jgi:Kef-type K+ transport system membrane component KefB